jgi:uncharacterized membrane protein
MVTKRKLHRAVNWACLAISLTTVVGAWLIPSIGTEGKLALTAGILATLRASIPELKRAADKVVDESGIPDAEVQK